MFFYSLHYTSIETLNELMKLCKDKVVELLKEDEPNMETNMSQHIVVQQVWRLLQQIELNRQLYPENKLWEDYDIMVNHFYQFTQESLVREEASVGKIHKPPQDTSQHSQHSKTSRRSKTSKFIPKKELLSVASKYPKALPGMTLLRKCANVSVTSSSKKPPPNVPPRISPPNLRAYGATTSKAPDPGTQEPPQYIKVSNTGAQYRKSKKDQR